MEADRGVYLTERETEIIRLVAAGQSAKETAIMLGIAPSTVERHIENVRLKTRTRNRAHLVAVVMQSGLLAECTVVNPDQSAISQRE